MSIIGRIGENWSRGAAYPGQAVRRGIDRLCADLIGLGASGAPRDDVQMAGIALADLRVRLLLRLRGILFPVLPGRTLWQRIFRAKADRSIIFVNNSYYHFLLMAAELRRRGWDALSLHPTTSSDVNADLHHGEDVRVVFDKSPASLILGLQVLLEIERRFAAIHFHGVGAMSVNFQLYTEGTQPESPAFPVEFAYLKGRGLKIGYSLVGCNDGIAQSSWNAWTGGMCGHCRFQADPRACGDVRNLGWGHRVATMADAIFAEMTPRLDTLRSRKVVTLPTTYGLDPELWSPDLQVPERYRLPRQEGEVIIFHGVGHFASRTTNDADPKGTRAVMAAVERLRLEGHRVRLEFVHSVPSLDVKYVQVQADIVVDQLLFGRYGAQARECLMLGRPVVGYLKYEDDIEDISMVDFLRECPVVNANPATIFDVLLDLVTSPEKRRRIGLASRDFALKWHSVQSGADRTELAYARIGIGAPKPRMTQPMYKIPLIRPVMTDGIKAKVNAVLDSGYLSEGPVTRAFEGAVRDFLGGGHVHAVTSATTGLELALRALGIGPGDEVVVPDFTYPATADVVAIVGATAVLVDVDRDTLVMDMAALESALSPRTKVVMPVSSFGNPVDYGRLNALKARHGFKVVEDAAPALGARYRDVPVGRLADITVFSLHPRKFVTTGEGGLVVTDDPGLSDWIKSYKHFGMQVVGEQLQPRFERIGTNCKFSDILAAVGLAQMEMIAPMLQRRLDLAARYEDMLSGVSGVRLQATTAGGLHSRQSFAIFIDDRDRVREELRALGIEVQIGTYALHMEPAFSGTAAVRVPGRLDGSLFGYHHCLVLPLYHAMTREEQDAVVAELKKAI